MPVQFKDYYSILGLDRKASEAEIRKAYRRLARKYHPDLNPGDKKAEERFKDIAEANDVLSDPEKRRKYDTLGPNWQHGADFTPPPGWDLHFDFGGARTRRGGGLGGFSEFFESLFGGLGGAGGAGFDFEELAAEARAPRLEEDAEIRLSLEDVYRGGTKEIEIERGEPCPRCGGRGGRCSTCSGTGVVRRRTSLKVSIPAGIHDGARIRLPGRGASGARGERRDLYLKVRYAPHPRFRADGADLHTELRVAPWEAVLGGTVSVATLDGPVDVKLPMGSSTGRQIRLRGKGLPQPGGRGDLYAVVQVVVPAQPSERERELVREWKRVSGFKPRTD
jgi:DnaJ-class molecular chaperone